VSTYEWLLALHVSAAFFLVGGSVVAAVFNVWARRSERPSDVALFLRLQMVGVIALGIGSVTALVLGLWLVHEAGYGYGQFWVWGAVILWLIGTGLGGRGGRSQEAARKLAGRLAAEGDAPSGELGELVRDRKANTMFALSGLATLLILVLMIWKPGH
jgi:uncharacterized membrane protein